MKILLTTDTYFPMINGVATSTSNLYKELKKNGHDVRILTLSHSKREKIEGDIYYLKSIKARIYPDARIKLPFKNRLIREIIDWKPDIIHSQTEFSTMIAAKHIAGKLDIPQIHTYHTLYEDYLNYFPGAEAIKKPALIKVTRLLLNTFDAVIAPTAKTEKVLLDYGVESNIYIIPTGINLKKYQKSFSLDEKEKLRSELGLKSDEKAIVYVGRIAEEKNISEIIELFSEIAKKVSNIKLLIVGNGPYLENLKLQVKDQKIDDKIIFTGMVKPEEVYKYYKTGDVFVTASTSETQGLTYIEALSCGCPIVCKYDKCVDGVIIQGVNGFSYKEPAEFSQYIMDILSDEELRKRLSKEAENGAQKYSSEVFACNVFNVYKKVLCIDNEELVV
jgi:1,2-diacylglycerol 3-alpha-glucosyltransferase